MDHNLLFNVLFILAAFFCAWVLGHALDALLNKLFPDEDSRKSSTNGKEPHKQ